MSGTVFLIGSGGAALVGAGVGALGGNPWTIAGDALVGEAVGAYLGYRVGSGAFEYLYDVLYGD